MIQYMHVLLDHHVSATRRVLKSNQENQDSSGSQKNVTQGQRPDMENGQTQHRT